jgi:hypothetical protein
MKVTIDSDLESVELAEYGSERKRKQKPEAWKKNRKKSEIYSSNNKSHLFLAIIQINSVVLKKYLMK